MLSERIMLTVHKAYFNHTHHGPMKYDRVINMYTRPVPDCPTPIEA